MTTAESFAALKAVETEKNPFMLTAEEWHTFTEEQKKVPLAKPDPELPYHICTDSLRAIKCDSEETALNILRQEGRYEVNKEKFLKLLTSDNELKSMGGKQATLNEPHLGYRNIILIKYWPTMYKWEVEICGSGKHIWVYEDEFEID